MNNKIVLRGVSPTRRGGRPRGEEAHQSSRRVAPPRPGGSHRGDETQRLIAKDHTQRSVLKITISKDECKEKTGKKNPG